MFDTTKIGRRGRWDFQVNDDYAVWQAGVSYLRSQYETADDLSFDDIYNFFLTTGALYAFLVEIVDDHHTSHRGGAGIVKLVNGAYRLFKRYTFGGRTYDHPITRPQNDVVLTGGSGLNFNTGVVSIANGSTTWTGSFWRPMIFMESGLKYSFGPDGIVQAIDLMLEEQLEI